MKRFEELPFEEVEKMHRFAIYLANSHHERFVEFSGISKHTDANEYLEKSEIWFEKAKELELELIKRINYALEPQPPKKLGY